MSESRGRVLYVFTARKQQLVAGVSAGTDPDTLLFGYNQLRSDPHLGVGRHGLHVSFYEPEYGSVGRRIMAAVGRLGPDVVQLRALTQFAANDVVFLTGGWPLLLAARLLAPSRRPRIVWLNMTLTNLIRRGSMRAAVLRRVAPLADRIVCVSSEQQRFLVERLGLPITQLPVVLSGTDVRFYDPSKNPITVTGRVGGYVLAAGRDSARDYATLVRAVRSTGHRTIIVCSPGNVAGIELPAHVEVRFDVSPRALRDLYAGADVVVIPTRGDDDLSGSDCSGTLVTLDALAMGRPVIVTARRSVSEYVTPGRHVRTVVAGDAEALGRAITDAHTVGAMVREGTEHVRQNRTTDHFAAGVATVIRELL